MTDIQSTQAFALAVSGDGGSLDAAQAWTNVVINYPSRQVDVGLVQALLPFSRTGTDDPVKVASAYAMVVVRGVPDWPISRAWTYTLENDFYVLSTMNETFVCNLSVDPPSWAIWGTGDDPRWRAWIGKQWIANLPYEEAYGSNVLVGDKALGTLFFLNPESATDESADFSISAVVPFKRVITGQIAIRGRAYAGCPGVEVTGSTGDLHNDQYADVELLTSDDEGATYDSQGIRTVVSGDYTNRLDWYSLGSMRAPGRLFRVVDYGALTRVDDLEMPDGDGQDTPKS
jgi:hypothetical protein